MGISSMISKIKKIKNMGASCMLLVAAVISSDRLYYTDTCHDFFLFQLRRRPSIPQIHQLGLNCLTILMNQVPPSPASGTTSLQERTINKLLGGL